MEKIDLRHANNDELYLVREQVVRMKLLNYKTKTVAESVGITAERVRVIWRNYKNDGSVAKPKKRGRKDKTFRLLTSGQEKEIRQTLIDKMPDQFKLNFMLWTREAVCQYIYGKYGVKISLRCATNYLKRWGMTCQRPTKRAYFQDNTKVERFKTEAYPAIKARSEAENGEIYWGDETGINNQENYERGYSPKGQPPVLLVESKRERINMISAINNYGTARFMLYDQKMTQQRFIEFLERLVSDAKRKVFFIVDNLKVHHGKLVAEWLLGNKDKLEMFFIPPYSPELNPDEYLNHALKLDVHGGIPPRTKTDIENKVTKFMTGLQAAPERVKAFFKHKKIAYQNA
jgi:transposase